MAKKKCIVCGEEFSLDVARVQRAMESPHVGDNELALLCWVCVRLKKSVALEGTTLHEAYQD